VSDHVENVSIARYNLRTIGGINIEKDDNGKIKAMTFDFFKCPEQRVDFMKIDVDGFECNVIRGGMHFLAKYHPIFIFIEVAPPQHQTLIKETLTKHGYQFLESLAGYDF
jgi:hypothetical protein